jgi:hypothetical protein
LAWVSTCGSTVASAVGWLSDVPALSDAVICVVDVDEVVVLSTDVIPVLLNSC